MKENQGPTDPGKGWVEKFFSRPWIIVGVIGLITVFFALQLPRVILDNDVVNFIPKDSPEVKSYEAHQDVYGSQVIMLMALKNTRGTVFEKDFLLRLKALTEKLENLPLADGVNSLTNTDYIRGEGDAVLVTPLAGEDFTGNPEQIRTMKEAILGWDLYHRSLVSEDFKSTQIMITIKAEMTKDDGPSDAPPRDVKKVMYDDIQKVLGESDLPGVEVHLAGTPVLAVLMSKNMTKDLVVLIPLVVLIIVLSLFVSFRRAGGIILPLATVVISSLWTIGLMAMMGVKLTMIATVIPVILVAVGSAYGIHVLSHYYDEALTQARTQSKEEYVAMVLHVLKKISLPVLLAGLTTMAGFGSLAFTTLIPVRDFGLFSTFGVLAALVTALSFIPAILIIRGPHEVKGVNTFDPDKDLVSKALLHFFTPFIKRPRITLVLSVAVVALSLWGANRVVVDNAVVDYFKEDTEVSRADRFLRTEFNGTKTFSINVKGTKKGDLNDPEVLAAMDDLAAFLEQEYPEVGKVISYAQFIKRINQVLNADEPADKLRGEVSASVADPAEETPGFGFGFEESSQEPDFGFGFTDLESSTSGTEPAPAAPTDDPQLTRTALLGLLNEAYALTDRRQPTAPELITLINRAVNWQGAAYYEIPRDPARYNQADREGLKNLIGNYLVLVGAGTESFADDPLEPSQAQMTVQLNSTGNLATEKIARGVKEFAAQRFPEGITVDLAGMAFIEKGVVDILVQSQIWNILSSIALVIIILTVFFRSFWAGLLSIVPLGMAIMVNFGLMGFLGIKLDAATSMVAAIAIGTGIDYTIHFLVAFHRGRKDHSEFHRLMNRTILTTGKAIMFNAVSVAGGFLVLTLSAFNPLVFLGLLIAITMMTSSFAALTIMPILLDLFKPKFLDRPMLTEVFEEKLAAGKAAAGE